MSRTLAGEEGNSPHPVPGAGGDGRWWGGGTKRQLELVAALISADGTNIECVTSTFARQLRATISRVAEVRRPAPIMSSPGRLVTKNGKASYERLDTMYESDDLDKVRESHGVKDFPNDGKVWPEYGASRLSRLFFWWYNPLVEYGTHVALEMEHIWVLHTNDSATLLYPRFKGFWDDECERVEKKKASHGGPIDPDDSGFKPGILRPIFRFGLWQVVKAGCILVVTIIMQFARPLLMKQILMVVEDDPDNPAIVAKEDAWMLAVAIALASVIDFLANAHYQITTWKGMLRLRQGIVGLLFHKVTRLSPGTKASYSQGKITNMMSNDADRVRMCVRVINNLWCEFAFKKMNLVVKMMDFVFK